MGIIETWLEDSEKKLDPLPDGEVRLNYLGRGIGQGINWAKEEGTTPIEAVGKVLQGARAGIVNDLAAAGAGIKSIVTGDKAATNDYIIRSPQTLTQWDKYTYGGDEKAGESLETTAEGKTFKINEGKGTEAIKGISDTAKDLGRTAALGALSEAWNKANGFFSNPVSSTANAIEQATSVSNQRNI